MNKSDRELLKKELRVRIDSTENPIDLPTGAHWAISDIKNPVRFFENLNKLLPINSVLYVEGTEIDHVVARFYEDNIYPTPAAIRRDTIFPTPKSFHMEFSKSLCESLLQFARRLPLESLFHHVKGYHKTTMIFTFHDAFSGVLRVAHATPEKTIEEFSKAVGGCYNVDRVENEDKALLINLLKEMESD